MPRKSHNKWVNTFHIKKGSPNEVSISVLDAAKQKVDNEKGEAPGSVPGVVSLFTVDKSAASSSVPSKTLAQKSALASLPAVNKPAQRRNLSELPEVDHADVAKEKKKPRIELPDPLAKVPKKEPSGDCVKEPSKEPIQAKPKESSEKKPFTLGEKKQKKIETPQQKEARKRTIRLVSRILLGVVAFVACLVCVSVVGTQLHESYLQQQGKISVVENALSQIEQADTTITKLNDALADPKSEESKTDFHELQQELPQASLSLQRAKSLVDQGIDGMRDGYDREAATRAKKAIEARMTMIDQGTVLLGYIIEALDTAKEADSAWAALIKADTTARDSAKNLLNPTPENLELAMSGTQSALQQLDESQQGFQQAGPMEVDYASYFAYIDKRKEALEYAQGAIEALQTEDLDAARSLQDSYAQADSDAVSLASGLPSSPSSLVYEEYQQRAANAIGSYEAARTLASAADAMLRDYYGGQRK